MFLLSFSRCFLFLLPPATRSSMTVHTIDFASSLLSLLSSGTAAIPINESKRTHMNAEKKAIEAESPFHVLLCLRMCVRKKKKSRREEKVNRVEDR
jgi:hypothetical protein